PAKMAGFCGVHLPKEKSPLSMEGAKKAVTAATEIVGLALGAEKLVELIVQFWQSLPFGVGPAMPEEYQYLVRTVPTNSPDELCSYAPVSKGPESINWALAKSVYLEAKRLQKLAGSGASTFTLLGALDKLNSDATKLVSTVQDGLQRQLID